MTLRPTPEMRAAAKTVVDRAAGRTHSDDGAVMQAIDEILTAALTLVERDYQLIRKPGVARPRRIAPVDHDPAALAWARKRAGWRQAHLAKAVGISGSLLSEAEKGTRGLAPGVLAQIAGVLNCPLTVLEGGPGTQSQPTEES